MSKTYCVRFEGTIVDGADPDVGHFGSVRPEARVTLARLVSEGHKVLVVSALCKYPRFYATLWRWLIHERVEFTDVWAGEGAPLADVYVDDLAVKLTDV